MKQSIWTILVLLLVVSLVTAAAVSQEKPSPPVPEKQKAVQQKEQPPVAVPAPKKPEEPKSLGVPIAAPQLKSSDGKLKVTEALLGTGVENRALVGEAKEFFLNEKVYLWLNLTGGPAEDITVTWMHGGKSYDTKLKVGGTPWRTWAYKTAAVAGGWTVEVHDASGTLLKQLEFQVVEKKM